MLFYHIVLLTCVIAVNDCANTGCNNGGTCVVDTCHCADGYIGATCDKEVEDIDHDCVWYYDGYYYDLHGDPLEEARPTQYVGLK